MKKTAIIYCEGHFGTMDGRIANDLIRNSGKYHIVGVIDSTKSGFDASECIEGVNNGIPVFMSFSHAIENLTNVPEKVIYGIDLLESTQNQRRTMASERKTLGKVEKALKNRFVASIGEIERRIKMEKSNMTYFIEKVQVERMIDEGLGGGVVKTTDTEKLTTPLKKKDENIISKIENEMAPHLKDIEKLGKENKQRDKVNRFHA